MLGSAGLQKSCEGLAISSISRRSDHAPLDGEAALECAPMLGASFNFPTWISEQRIVIQLIIYIGILATISVVPLILWFLVVFRPKKASTSAQPDQFSES
jgi:hypothetical protein